MHRISSSQKLKMMPDSNIQLHRDNDQLQDALSQSMRGKLASPLPDRTKTEELMRALMQAGYQKPDQQGNVEAGQEDESRQPREDDEEGGAAEDK